jgi:xylan 1,4-beta-xylosidase
MSIGRLGRHLLDRMQATHSNKYFRSHHTFTQDTRHGVLRGQNVYSEDEQGNPVYDFSNVNKVFGEYVKRGMKPIVEYDYLPDLLNIKESKISTGNDEGMIMRNTGPTDWKKWSDLMKAATQNFMDVFGKEEVRTWYFEVWNEPDGWPVEEMDVFFKMYDVFVDAVTSIDPELKVGGPACYHEYFLRPFLQHVVHGTNHVTGNIGTRIDFISYHIYGLSGSWLNQEPDIHPRVQRFAQSVLWLQRLISKYPQLKEAEFHLNEWGMSSNYYRLVKDYPDLEYRNSEESALFLVKLVNSLFQIEDNYDFPTSLLLYWGFCWEADEDEFFVGKRELTTAGNTPKPIQTGFEMLARLKENRIKVSREVKDSRFGLLATASNDKDLAFITYNYDETDDDIEKADGVSVKITGLVKGQKYLVKITKLDRRHNNTYRAWQRLGQPESSAGTDITMIRRAGELQPSDEFEVMVDENGELKLDLQLHRHSMQLIELGDK